jgi:hypothetical protein
MSRALLALLVALVLCVAANGLLHLRLFVYRHDQKWRRDRGALLGDWPLSTGLDDLWNKADYAPEGHRLIPFALCLQVIMIGLAVATLAVALRAP